MTWSKKEYRGTCRVCGQPVVVTTEFLSVGSYTCNMDDAVRTGAREGHTAEELRSTWALVGAGR